jgi:hypothetical protein
MSYPKLLINAAFWLLAFTYEGLAQKQIEVREQTWLGYFNQTRFTNKSGLWVDLHFRGTDNFFQAKSIAIARFAYIYYLSEHIRLMAGYAYAPRFSNAEPHVIPEHRPWQQFLWVEKKNGFNLTQSFRIEQRFRQRIADNELTSEFEFNWRLRYNFVITVPLKGKEILPGTPFLYFNNDTHINAGKNIKYNYLDQNRSFLGLGYQFSEQLNVHLGYMFIFQQEPVPEHFVHIHAIRLYFIHNLDLRNDR